MQLAPALKLELGYGDVTGAYFGECGQVHSKAAFSGGSEIFRCDVFLFNAETDVFPFPDASFSLVLACEIIEHLYRSPMHFLHECRRILVPGGALLLTTPNAASTHSVARVLIGKENPQVFSAYPSSGNADERAVHVREYTPWEIRTVLESAGFVIEQLFTEHAENSPSSTWAYEILSRHGFSTEDRGEQIYVLALKGHADGDSAAPPFLIAGSS
jgi:SAM-dependent methyltransferase